MQQRNAGAVLRRPQLSDIVESLLGDDLPVAVELWDGGRLGPPDPEATVSVRSPDALVRLVSRPGELGFSRAYVAGDIELEGDIYAVFDLRDRLPRPGLHPREWLAAVRVLGVRNLRRLPPPPEEARLHGRRHSRHRDAASISHHYDVSDEFYRLVLGPSMTYSCGLFADMDSSLEDAQSAKLDLVCRKLGVGRGTRLLDVGCGWGSLALHAARHHGARVVGVTLSHRQADWARDVVAEAGLGDRVEIRVQDYRDVTDGPFDAISSVGMFEHVGLSRLAEYFDRLRALLAPGGRLLNHAISRPAGMPAAVGRNSFINRYVFPDGELHEVGSVISAMQLAGFEARHMESLREHYALTLRRWVANLERDWERAVRLVGGPRARIWRLYMAGSAVGFEAGRIGVDQVLAVAADHGCSGLGLRPRWEPAPRRAEVTPLAVVQEPVGS
jgi:cyclopropane-fatty-acyl-phospholipid synthase